MAAYASKACGQGKVLWDSWAVQIFAFALFSHGRLL